MSLIRLKYLDLPKRYYQKDSTVKILVVEDEANLAGYLKKGLEEEGHEISIAHNCEEAREIRNPNQFEMVLLGLILPDGSGIQLARDLKKVQPLLPIVILKIREEALVKRR